MKKGLLLVNLGSPNSTAPKDVKKYLAEFLMDPYVIDYPYWLRAFIVRGIILRTRPKKSAEAYRRIWWDAGSPLIVISKRLAKSVGRQVALPVALGMRYGSPSIADGLCKLADQGVTGVQLVPLYPQYAMSTTKTVIEKAKRVRDAHFKDVKLDFLPAFYNQPEYVKILAESIAPYLEGQFDRLLFSYHGVPERHIRKTDPTQSHCQIDGSCCITPSPAHRYCYRHQCLEITRSVKAHLRLPDEQVTTAFQSRLGRDSWLKPYTDETLRRLPRQGVKKLLVVTPAFVSDCLETLEEIGMAGRDTFLAHGGEHYRAIPCLNDGDSWAALLASWATAWAGKATAPSL